MLSEACANGTCMAGHYCDCRNLSVLSRCSECQQVAATPSFVSLMDAAQAEQEKQAVLSEAPNTGRPNERETPNMDSFIRNLASKRDSAQNALGELQDNIEAMRQAEGEVEEFIAEIENLIDSLNSLPSVSVSVEGFDFDTDNL